MVDKYGYPTKKELKTIIEWEINSNKDVCALIEHIRAMWQYADVGYFELKGKHVLHLRLSTGGWSGNEDIINALQKNYVFWLLYWQKSKRGGHYWFRISLKRGKQ